MSEREALATPQEGAKDSSVNDLFLQAMSDQSGTNDLPALELARGGPVSPKPGHPINEKCHPASEPEPWFHWGSPWKRSAEPPKHHRK